MGINVLEKVDLSGISETSKKEIERIIDEQEQCVLELERALMNTQQRIDNMMNEKRHFLVQIFHKLYQNEDSIFLNSLTEKQYKDIFKKILDNESIEDLKAFVYKEDDVDELDKEWLEIREENREALMRLYNAYYPDDDPSFIKDLAVDQVRKILICIEDKEKIEESKKMFLATNKRYY